MPKLLRSFSTAAVQAASSLRAHKLRSFLTLLGVIIGVSSVVIVGSAVDGLGNYAEQTTSKVFGSDSFQVGQLLQVGRMSRRERLEKLKYNRRIRAEDLSYLRQVTGESIVYSPYRLRAEDTQRGSEILEATSIVGVSAELAQIRDVNLTEGRFFTEQEEQNRAFVTIIGEDLRAKFFPNTTPLDKTIRFAGYEFRVIGVQEKIGNAGGQSQDNILFVPETVYTKLYGPDRTMVLFARARPESGLSLDEALDLVRVALRTRFKARPGMPDNFDSITPDSIRQFIAQITGVIGAVVVPLTAISLVVGGIVIMNIMLVSVTERTREIGVRKSLGARQSDLMLQFLMESVFMSAAGGLIGLAIGAGVARVGTALSGVELSISATYIFLALFVSSAVGIVSGWYPARRAARMDPVEALRAE